MNSDSIDLGRQVNIFSDDLRQLHFAELCNALYERELNRLSQKNTTNIGLLQREIGGLKHHIKRAAYNLLQHQAPLDIDIHNASWQHKQAAKCPAKLQEQDKTLAWYNRPFELGVCAAVYVNELGVEHIELDSIDRFDLEEAKLHLNKFGWFNFYGQALADQSDSKTSKTQLIKPSNSCLTAACCGHSWNHKGRSQPRLLTLRELMLSFSINWQTFR
ncbi:hypothetical protein [Flavobacterium sp. W21_SRS_FM6]|uniref:hypothetical protein n=1 Tax=Flavobacterium sp. W21_SRS_FM6 TaxID=3240268 RepID=UPI003F9391A8